MRERQPKEQVEICPQHGAVDALDDLEEMVMMIATTPSLNASSLPLLTFALSGPQAAE